MHRGALIAFAILLLGLFALAQEKQSSDQQLPDAPQPQAQPAPPPPPPSQPPPEEEQKPATGAKKALKRAKPNCIQIFGRVDCSGKSEQEKESEAKQAQEDEENSPRPLPSNQPAPRSSEESSSKDQESLGPMPGASSDYARRQRPYNPHRADKDVEVGDFYFKRENYRAAESRYAEALEWMPNDAIAFFKLAQAQEKLGKMDQARGNYQQYLKILPKGEQSEEARKALARLEAAAKPPATSPPAQNPR